MSKFLDAYGDVIGKKQFSYKKMPINLLLVWQKRHIVASNTIRLWNEQTSTIKSVLKDGVLDTKTQIPRSSNILS